MTNIVQLTRGQKKWTKNLLTKGGAPKDLDHRRHAQEEERKMTPTLPPFVRPGSLHISTFCRMLWCPSDFYRIWFWLNWCLKNKIRSQWKKFAPSYNPFFGVIQITILAIARIARNTTRFSPWYGGSTLSTTLPMLNSTSCLGSMRAIHSSTWLQNGPTSSQL